MTTASAPRVLPVADAQRQLPDSYWVATAGPQVSVEQLRGTVDADVAIVGAGFVGLRAALELATKGINVVVLDTEEPGWGASGRSAGQVNPQLHVLPAEVVERYGSHHAEILFNAARGAADELFALIRDHGIDCENYQKGWIQGAQTPDKMSLLETRQREWARLGWDVEMVSRQDIMRLIGSPAFYGGALFRRGSAVHPLALTRGLVRAAIGAGARIFSKTRAETIEKVDGRWVVSCNSGDASVRCENVFWQPTPIPAPMWFRS